MCPACRRPVAQCTCRAAAPAAEGPVRVWRESKGRGGKTVSIVRGLPLPPAELARLGQELKAACGTGGTVKDGCIEVQGDHADRLVELLVQRGWKARRAGG